jgi:hypothetical protein
MKFHFALVLKTLVRWWFDQNLVRCWALVVLVVLFCATFVVCCFVVLLFYCFVVWLFGCFIVLQVFCFVVFLQFCCFVVF